MSVARALALFSGAPPYRGLDGIKLGNPAQGLGGDRRASRLMDVIELPPRMGPTGGQDDIATRGQPFEPGITVDLQNAVESLEVRSRALRLAIGAIEVDGRRRIGATPRPIVARIDPQSAHLGAAAAGVEHRDRCVVGKDFA